MLLAGVLCAVLAFGAQAAPLADGETAPSVIDPTQPSSAGSTLDRTLRVDTDAAQRDVELLLETRGAGETAPPPVSRRPPVMPAPSMATPARSADPQVERAPVPEPVRGVIRTLRDHRDWLLGALGLVAVLAAAVRLWQQRRAGASERRLRQLAEQHRSPRGRRRSSRR